MSVFPATDIALEGFRLTRERIRVVAIWSALQVASSLVALVVIMVFAGKEMAAFTTAAHAGRSLDELARTMEPLMPILLYLTPLNIVVQVLLLAACYRVILRPTEERRAFLAVGADEVRLLLVGLYLTFVGIAALALARILGDALSHAAVAVGPGGRFLVVGYSAAVVFGAAFLFVRFSLALPLTFARRKIVIMESWRLTRGRHWALGGAYFMAFMLAALVYVLGVVIGSVLQSFDTAAIVDAKALLTPGMIGSTAWMAAIGALISVIVQAPGATALLSLDRPLTK